METPKPTLIVNGQYAKHPKPFTLVIPLAEAAIVRKILANHRRRQTRRLGARDEDPDPYDPSYIFFCLDGRRET